MKGWKDGIMSEGHSGPAGSPVSHSAGLSVMGCQRHSLNTGRPNRPGLKGALQFVLILTNAPKVKVPAIALYSMNNPAVTPYCMNNIEQCSVTLPTEIHRINLRLLCCC